VPKDRWEVAVMSIISDIDDHIRQGGGRYPAWYCGIAADPRDRLFNNHNVAEKNSWWIFRDCGTDATARKIEDHFHAMGCKGDVGGGDWNTRFVYAYKITGTTVEDA
jgi:hypothetical protein